MSHPRTNSQRRLTEVYAAAIRSGCTICVDIAVADMLSTWHRVDTLDALARRLGGTHRRSYGGRLVYFGRPENLPAVLA
jgi:hypothetical protein